MGRCAACGVESPAISERLGACGPCLRSHRPEAIASAERAHRLSRAGFGLPTTAPSDPDGLRCSLCARRCRIGEGRCGYCGVRAHRGGRLVGGDERAARVSYYYDALPTNCVAGWVCPAGSECGYPRYTYCRGPEYGYLNLAVFYEACSFDCLYCQNWHYRTRDPAKRGLSAEELAQAVNERTSCICFFGGDPGPQAPHALAAARMARERTQGRPLRICWETNGAEDPAILDQMVELSLESGGCVKFDLKAFHPALHRALCGMGNRRTRENFRRAARRIPERPDPPLVVASTPLVPGYVDVEEVRRIAGFIAETDRTIPYSLLGFHPDFLMGDLPCTSERHAREAEETARAEGLERVRIGNRFILGRAEY